MEGEREILFYSGPDAAVGQVSEVVSTVGSRKKSSTLPPFLFNLSCMERGDETNGQSETGRRGGAFFARSARKIRLGQGLPRCGLARRSYCCGPRYSLAVHNPGG